LNAIVLALGAAVGWGVADFFGGKTSREVSALAVLGTSQGVGFSIAVLAALTTGLDSVNASDLLYAALSGLSLTLGLGALYRAMAVGAMAIAAPIAATGAVIPVVVGLASGDRVSALQLAGIVAALGGVAVCSYTRELGGRRAGMAVGAGLALLAALGGGLTATALAAASSAGVLWVLLVQRATVFAAASALALRLEGRVTVPRRLAPVVVAIGVLDLAATGLFTAAAARGDLSLVAVVGALYPVVTVLLAFVVLSERLVAYQVFGVTAAFAGVAAIAGG
jgi:drug/metabolite transporter (DMT)-like permease